MQKTKVHTQRGAKDKWLLKHATALLAYAKTNPEFAESFAYYIQKRDWNKTQTSYAGWSQFIMAEDIKAATQVARWLLNTLDNSKDALATRSLLATWAGEFEEPQDAIIGIMGIAIMGPTFGILDKKKKCQQSALRVIVSQDKYNNLSKIKLVETVQNESMTLVSEELRLAGGNGYLLHPDTACWLLAEPITKIYVASDDELKNIKEMCQSHYLPHYSSEPNILAISPIVSESFEEAFDIEKAT